MSAQIKAILSAVVESMQLVINASAEAATIAAVADGYRGFVWICVGATHTGFRVYATRDANVFHVNCRELAELGASNVQARQVEITEQGAQEMLTLISKAEGISASPQKRS